MRHQAGYPLLLIPPLVFPGKDLTPLPPDSGVQSQYFFLHQRRSQRATTGCSGQGPQWWVLSPFICLPPSVFPLQTIKFISAFLPLQSVETKTPPSPLVCRRDPRASRHWWARTTPLHSQRQVGRPIIFIPFQYSRPRSIRLDRFQTAAVTTELRRLQTECCAVEPAPEHDGD